MSCQGMALKVFGDETGCAVACGVGAPSAGTARMLQKCEEQ